jgi:hypothetical protein
MAFNHQELNKSIDLTIAMNETSPQGTPKGKDSKEYAIEWRQRQSDGNGKYVKGLSFKQLGRVQSR